MNVLLQSEKYATNKYLVLLQYVKDIRHVSDYFACIF